MRKFREAIIFHERRKFSRQEDWDIARYPNIPLACKIIATLPDRYDKLRLQKVEEIYITPGVFFFNANVTLMFRSHCLHRTNIHWVRKVVLACVDYLKFINVVRSLSHSLTQTRDALSSSLRYRVSGVEDLIVHHRRARVPHRTARTYEYFKRGYYLPRNVIVKPMIIRPLSLYRFFAVRAYAIKRKVTMPERWDDIKTNVNKTRKINTE